MPTVIGVLSPDGLDDAPHTAQSLAEAARFESDGVYTVTRTYKSTQVLLLDAHLDRMETSAELESIPLELDRQRLRQALRELIVFSGYPESRFRITVPRDNPEQRIISIEPFTGVPEAHKRLGVKTITVNIERETPLSKDVAWMQRRAVAVADKPSAYEYLIVNASGQILEGLTSNFYAVREGEVFTASEGDVLGGISRRVVMAVVPHIVPLNLTPITHDELPEVEEAFLTSSSRGVIPIVQIDAQRIGAGKPGQLTEKISHAYDQWVEENLQEI